MQRCSFLLNPFSARKWRRRYDLLISFIVWSFVSLACSPFILMRSSSSSPVNTSSPVADTEMYSSPSPTSPSSSSSTAVGCFKDLPMRRLPHYLSFTMMALAELFGFLIPLAFICYSSFRIVHSLNQRHSQDQQYSSTLNYSARSRLHSVTSICPSDKYHEKLTNGEKQRALRMVLSCFALFLFCFAPYHINFLLYLMVSQDTLTHCATRLAVRQFHPMSLCLASLSCCLNPLLYYFLTSEFRSHLTKRTSSFTSSLLSSPISSLTQQPTQQRMMSMESSYSERE